MNKSITIELNEKEIAFITVNGCNPQDMYAMLCAYIAHVAQFLKNPDDLDEVVAKALADTKDILSKSKFVTPDGKDFNPDNITS